jgi:DNA-binding response OmpR family regulator
MRGELVRPRRVAVVEDDAEVRVELERLLTARGYEVACYRSHRAARRAMRVAPPDLIVLDSDTLEVDEPSDSDPHGTLVLRSYRAACARDPGVELSAVPTLVMKKWTPAAVLVTSIARLFAGAPQPVPAPRASAEERNETLTVVAGGVAHDINDPLACILVNLEELRQLLPDDLAPSVRDLLDDSLDAAHRIRRSVRDLQRFLHPHESGASSVEVEQALDAAMRLLHHQLRHRATIDKLYSPSPMVVSKDSRLRQLFIHLFLDLAASLPEGRANETLVRVVTRTSALGECEVEVTTRQARSTLDSAPSIRALCHAIVDSLGGRIEPIAGKGWRVTLPAAKPAMLSQTRTKVAPARGKGPILRVLVVDDDRMLARALARGLAPHEVTMVHSAQQAMELLRKDAGFALVLCDALMPRGSGVELHRQLRTMRPGAEKSIVFMTAAPEDSPDVKVVRSLPNRLLHKPFEVSEVRRMLEGELS